MRFSGSRERVCHPKATVGVATGPRRDAPRRSDSLPAEASAEAGLLNDPPWVNDSVRFALRKQPFGTRSLRFSDCAHVDPAAR